MVETNRAEESPIKKMDSKRIKEIQQETAHSESVSVQQALLKVWNECAQQSQSEIDELTKRVNQLSEVNDYLIKHNLKHEKQNAELTKEVERLRNKYEPSEYSKEVNEMYKKFSD